MPKPLTVDSVEMLLEYQKILEREVLELRALACEKAEKVRKIKRTITTEQMAEVEEKKTMEDAWSGKLQPHLKPQNNRDAETLMELIENVK